MNNTNDFIRRGDAIEAVHDRICQIGYERDANVLSIRQAVRDVPAADVVEVVRCGQCKHCVEHYDTDGNAPYWTCKEWDSGTYYDGYCHYGERKDGGRDDA